MRHGSSYDAAAARAPAAADARELDDPVEDGEDWDQAGLTGLVWPNGLAGRLQPSHRQVARPPRRVHLTLPTLLHRRLWRCQPFRRQ